MPLLGATYNRPAYNAEEYNAAIRSLVVELITELNASWTPVLSASASWILLLVFNASWTPLIDGHEASLVNTFLINASWTPLIDEKEAAYS